MQDRRRSRWRSLQSGSQANPGSVRLKTREQNIRNGKRAGRWNQQRETGSLEIEACQHRPNESRLGRQEPLLLGLRFRSARWPSRFSQTTAGNFLQIGKIFFCSNRCLSTISKKLANCPPRPETSKHRFKRENANLSDRFRNCEDSEYLYWF